MKQNKRLFIGLLGIIAVAVIMGFSLMACEDAPEENPDGNKEYWKITWHLNSGSWADGYTRVTQVEKGQALNEPPEPTKDGYTFQGWYTNSGLTSSYNFSNSVTGNLTLYAGWQQNPQAPTHLLFTSDVHWRETAKGIFPTWMETMTSTVHPSGVDYMSWGGDHAGSNNNESYTRHWTNAEVVMKKANEYVDSGYIKNKNLFIFGNHEWNIPASNTHGGDYYNHHDSWAAEQLEENHTTYTTTSGQYVIYVLGAIYTPPPSDGCLQQFAQSEIDRLEEYLVANAASNTPLFIIAHHPIHSININGSARYTRGNPRSLVDLLNSYANQRDIYFLWGHNHSQNPTRDANYDTIYLPGSSLMVLADDASSPSWAQVTEKQIEFTYIAAGCMSDVEYTGGSDLVLGKAVLATIDNGNVSFMYYNKNVEPFVPRVVAGSGTEYWQISWQLNSGNWAVGYTPPAQVVKGQPMTVPSPPTKAGYTFDGWYSNEGLTASYTFNSAVTNNLTLYAKWEPVTITGPYDYIISGSGVSFTATRSGTALGAADTMANTLAAIRTDAGGQDLSIQFGDNTTPLTTTASAAFSGAWGTITLTGSISSDLTGDAGTVSIGDTVSVNITGSIANTSAASSSGQSVRANSIGKAIYINSTGGTVEVKDGATITANTGNALYHAGSGTVIISGGTLTSANQAASGTGDNAAGTVCTYGGSANLTISGGTVTNTYSSTSAGFGVFMNSNGTTISMLTLSGGTIDVGGYRAVGIIHATSVTLGGAGPTLTGDKPLYISNGSGNEWVAGAKITIAPGFSPAENYKLILGFSSSAAPAAGRLIVEGGAPYVGKIFKNNASTQFTVSGNDLVF